MKYKDKIEMSISDAIDRFSIVSLKKERIGNEVQAEYDFYTSKFKELLDDEQFKHFFKRLKNVNGLIWDAEAEIRRGDLDTSENYEYNWKLALRVRNLNRERNSIKNEIVEATGEGFKEIRVNIIANP